MSEESSICVPRRLPDWSPCSNDVTRQPIDYDPASLLDLYFEQLCLDYQCTREQLSGHFFKSTHGVNGKRFINGNIGKNTLGQVGVEVAKELLLPFPETFTGHCWRRSAGTNASNNGVNVTTLMSMMGWACPKTAMEYVKHSRFTSLTMSMYLANVQRQNVVFPFPSTVSERSRKTVFVSKNDTIKDQTLALRESSTLDVRDQDLVVESVNGVAVDESNSNLNSVDNFGMESSVVAKDGSGKVNGSENIVESLQLSSIDNWVVFWPIFKITVLLILILI